MTMNDESVYSIEKQANQINKILKNNLVIIRDMTKMRLVSTSLQSTKTTNGQDMKVWKQLVDYMDRSQAVTWQLLLVAITLGK